MYSFFNSSVCCSVVKTAVAAVATVAASTARLPSGSSLVLSSGCAPADTAATAAAITVTGTSSSNITDSAPVCFSFDFCMALYFSIRSASSSVTG